uniref:MFS domain-containing protein n=1 Tax=Angiostrongylus cantonensis TaxID=6313 RepID=A0A158P6R4_ANGCA
MVPIPVGWIFPKKDYYHERSRVSARAAIYMRASPGGGFSFGYQVLITNPAQAAFIQFLNTSYTETHGVQQNRENLELIWGVIVSTFFWGATLGSLLIQVIADSFGRKKGIVLAFVVQIASLVIAIASYFTTSYITYSISRVILGVAVSVNLGIGPMFIVECSPVACRGMISLATGFMLQLGVIAGSIAAMPETWGTDRLWWLIYALELALTVFITVPVAFIPESPRLVLFFYNLIKFFIMARNETRKAASSFKYYHGISEAEIELLVADAQSADKEDRPLVKDEKWLCGFLVSAVVMGGTVMSGIAVVSAFAFEILLTVGLDGLQASLANIIFCLVTAETWIGWCVVVTICIFYLLFTIGPGPISFFVPGELVGQRARAAAYTWVNIIMNGVRSALLAVYFPLRALLGAPLSYVLLFFAPCIITAAICYYWLPETSGKTPEQARVDMHGLPRICGTIKKSYDIEMDQKPHQSAWAAVEG